MERSRTFSGVSWETTTGYCRAIRVGNNIYVSGTAPIDADGKVFAPGMLTPKPASAFREFRRHSKTWVRTVRMWYALAFM